MVHFRSNAKNVGLVRNDSGLPRRWTASFGAGGVGKRYGERSASPRWMPLQQQVAANFDNLQAPEGVEGSGGQVTEE
jgi:hypothetical protein